MNTGRILQLADALESGATPIPGFDMRVFYASHHSAARSVNRLREDQGAAVGALAAHTVKFFDCPVSTRKIVAAAAEILGLSPGQAEDLFGPRGVRPGDVTRAMAAETLRRLAKTGVVQWYADPQPIQEGSEAA